MKKNLNEDSTPDLAVISAALKAAGEHGLEVELVWSALRFSAAHKDWGMEDVMSAALDDWDI